MYICCRPEGWLEAIAFQEDDDSVYAEFCADSPSEQLQKSTESLSAELGRLLISGQHRIAGGAWHQLHLAAEAGDAERTKRLLQVGGSEQADWLTAHANVSIQPLHRAARHGHVHVVRELVAGKADVDACLEPSKLTAYHIACDYGHTELVEYLLDEAKCDANLKTDRGKTGWDLSSIRVSLAGGSDPELSSLQRTRSAAHSQQVCEILDSRADSGHTMLAAEKRSRANRPTVPADFVDCEFSFERLTFWSLEQFGNWTFLAEGSFGKVYRVRDVFTKLEAGGGMQVGELAIKAAKQNAGEQLRSEITE